MKYYYFLLLSLLHFGLSAQVWQALGTGLWYPNENYPQGLNILATYLDPTTHQNRLYVGGNFTIAGGNNCTGIAAWDGVGWNCVGSAGVSGVYAGVVYNNNLYVTGDFQSINGVSATYIAKFDGTTWSAVGSGLNSGGATLCVYNGALYVGGYFDVAGGVTAHKIAKWNDTVWSAVGGGLSDYADCMTVQDSKLYVGGNFTTADQSTVTGLAVWDGNSWSAPQSLTSLTVPIQCLASCQDTLYFSDGNYTVWQFNGNSINELVPGNGNIGVKSLTTIGNSLYMGFYNAGGVAGANGMIYSDTSFVVGAISGGGDGYIQFENQLVSIGNVSFDNIARLWEQPVAQISAERQTICDSGSVSFTNTSQQAVQSTSWQFQGGNPSTSTSPNPTVSYDAPGTYTVTLMVSNLAGGDTETITNYISVVPPLAVPTISQAGTALISSSGSGNQWYDNGVAIAGATGNFYTLPTTFADTSCYSLIVTDTIGCSAKSDSICFDPTQTGVGIATILENPLLSISPNPTSENINLKITTNLYAPIEIELYSSIGQRVSQEMRIPVSNPYTGQIDCRGLSKGTYLLHVTMGTQSIVSRIEVL